MHIFISISFILAPCLWFHCISWWPADCWGLRKRRSAPPYRPVWQDSLSLHGSIGLWSLYLKTIKQWY